MLSKSVVKDIAKETAKVNMSILRSSMVGLVSAVLLSACSTVFDKHVEWQQVKPEQFPVLTAIGQAPISLQNSQHKTQRMLMAIKASKIAAYAELAEQVYGQSIDGKTTMSNLVVDNQQLKASVQGIIRGAKVVKSYPVGDSYTTELRLDFKDVYEIYSASSNRKEIKNISYY
jgi:outer membrane protein FlgP